jgi:hypothetical protein
MSRHGGMVEAVSAGFGESVNAHRENARTGINEDRDRGVRGSITRSRGQGKPWTQEKPGRGEKTPPRSSRDPPKRSVRRETHGSPVSVGGTPLSTRPMKNR